jgi:CBS domain containing-hemolysin-like protein
MGHARETHGETIVYTGVMLASALLLVCLNGFFVAAEFSFVKARKTRLELLAAEGNKNAKSALFGISRLDAYLSVCQLGITLSSLGLGWLGEPAVAVALHPLFTLLSITDPALLISLSVAVGFTIITLLHVVFGELVPKSVAIQKSESAVLWLARPMRFFYVLCFPMVSVMNGISNFFLRLAGIGRASEAEESHSPEELRMLILQSSKGGQLGEAEGRMLDNIFSFYQKTAKDIMLHRVDALALDIDTPKEEVLDVIRKSGHTRFPVYEGNRDNIVGFVHAREVLRREDGTGLRSILRSPVYAHESIHLDALLRLMQAKRQQLCLVVDEYGAWQGILTMEDMVEAIVGDIQDEFDNEAPDVLPQTDGSFLVSADLSLEDLARYLPVHMDRDIDPYKILTAHVLEALGRIPRVGDAVELCGCLLTVADMERNRVRRLRVNVLPSERI